MAKPLSMALGNTLTLVQARFGIKRDGEEYKWKENADHRMLNIPRVIVAVKSECVEIGPEQSELPYPKVGEFSEDSFASGGAGRLVLKYVKPDPINRQEITNILIYDVRKPTHEQ